MYSDTFRVFAGFRFTLDDIIIDTESARAVAIVTSQATQIGEAFGYPGSGRQFTLKVAFVLRFDKDLLVSETRVYDFTGLLVQLGVLRAKKG
jgi:predicted ester cyclase